MKKKKKEMSWHKMIAQAIKEKQTFDLTDIECSYDADVLQRRVSDGEVIRSKQ